MYELKWLVPKRVILVTSSGDVTENELKAGMVRMQAMAQAGESPVHLITDSRDIRSFPTSISTLLSIVRNVSITNLVGYRINVSTHPMSRRINQIMTRLTTGRDAHIFDTMEDALAFLRYQDLDLQDLTETKIPLS